ncbi:universal stress protein [Nodosilinea sp. LEGE 07088]|uniref:universal stress protein n=1 Tax=Nodosilinea sp. LEGE 07088 TaxID=2777968 RepID=UPI0018810BCB|nr:universal stress protein [Nodosilinea sp. LEGE 07088]MBE9140287.1 universal stress protein [Nodosilinea sp. LEGE 07088]
MTLFTSNNVLVPIDFSKEAHQALVDTLEFVKDPAKLHVIHVLHSLEPTEPGVVWQTIDDQTRIDKIKAVFYKQFPDEAYQQVKFTVKVGHPSAEIIDYAEHNAIDLIVIPSSGRTGLSRFFLGSVAERVVRFSHCPVLVIRG